MILIGRLATLIAVVGTVTAITMVMGTSAPAMRTLVDRAAFGPVLAVLFAATPVAWFVGWGLALYHWGIRYPGSVKRVWGLALILGLVPGSWLYWMGAGLRPAPESASRRLVRAAGWLAPGLAAALVVAYFAHRLAPEAPRVEAQAAQAIAADLPAPQRTGETIGIGPFGEVVIAFDSTGGWTFDYRSNGTPPRQVRISVGRRGGIEVQRTME